MKIDSMPVHAGGNGVLPPGPRRFRPPGDVRILDVRTCDGLAAHEDAWNRLLLASPDASPMMSYAQISAFLETQLAEPESWLCLFAYEAERLLAVLPLIVARVAGLPGFKVLLLKTPYDIMHTGSVDCLTLPGREDLLEVFVDYLTRMPGCWPVIRIREIPDHSAAMKRLAAPERRLAAFSFHSGAENHIEVPADFTTFHERLSSNFRRQLKRGMKKLQELPDVRFACRDDSRDVDENMRRFEAVEDAGWKGEGNTSVKAMPANARFFRLAAQRYAAAGWMEWNFLESGGAPIGAHYAVRVRRTLYLLKIGYDERHAACSPGNLLLEKVVESASVSGDVDEINCVADCAWHRNWAMKRRDLYDVIILPSIPLVSSWVARFFASETGGKLIDHFTKKGEVSS